MLVGEPNGFPRVDSNLLRQAGEFVGNRDVHIAIGVLHQFDHLRRRGIGQQDFALHKSSVKLAARLRRCPVNSTNHSGVLDQFL